ncbi:MAG: F0F1 ATP synthase subunit gamma [Coxiellaceae bacterium]|nr:F0F1 ATP synthase subunit gamma [Coxiellaceae bacterium]
MSQAKEIRTKIGSIKSTQKITRAMELVAASKMRRAQDRMALSKPYATKIRQVISHVAASHAEYPHPFLLPREEIKRVGYIVVTSDRGLCGGLNINLFRKILTDLKPWNDKGVEVDFCLIGRKAESFFKRHGGNVLAMADHLGDAPEAQDLVGIVKVMLDAYVEGKLDAVYIASNEFVNTMVQKPYVRQLLPLEPDESEKKGHWDYIYEPDSARELLDMLLRRYIESQVYQAVVENIACFQAAQMVAMKSATDNAGELIDDLQLVYNKARQASITAEISEIVGGAAALE